jgi:hypothetical protein
MTWMHRDYTLSNSSSLLISTFSVPAALATSSETWTSPNPLSSAYILPTRPILYHGRANTASSSSRARPLVSGRKNQTKMLATIPSAKMK